MDQFLDILKALGLPPALAGIGLVLAILLRYLRGMVPKVGSGATYVAALVFGLVGSLLDPSGTGVRIVGQHTLALTALVLLSQKILEMAAKSVPWLPQDDEWSKK